MRAEQSRAEQSRAEQSRAEQVYQINSKKQKTASWAFYSGNTHIRGIGTKMEKNALDYAFNHLNLDLLKCEVLEFNQKVIEFHQKHGFTITNILKKAYERDGAFYDIYQLAITKDDWLKQKN